jgi:spore maturation protein CgeB
MRIVVFCHSHDVQVYEPRNAWSLENLLAEHGHEPVRGFHAAYPSLRSHSYDPNTLDLDLALDHTDLVLVHEWNQPRLVKRIGDHRRASGRYTLLFHDTHHRMVTNPAEMRAYDLGEYDAVLAFGASLAETWSASGLARRVFVWHEAADTRVFRPLDAEPAAGDLVWIGNWGDDERAAELREFLIDPVRDLRLRAEIYGVRYPAGALRDLAAAGIDYCGWLPNYRAPETFARFRFTVHVPRRPYARALPGIPTIRVFEALACGIPLISAPWDDCENLFTPGEDFLTARNGEEMRSQMRALREDREFAQAIALRGRRTVLERHTCSRRVDELLEIYQSLSAPAVRSAIAPQERAS